MPYKIRSFKNEDFKNKPKINESIKNKIPRFGKNNVKNPEFEDMSLDEILNEYHY